MKSETVSKILIVDDNTFYLSLLKTILKSVDATVYMADCGKEALKLIDENDFALAILDIEMPEMNGFELATHIRNQKNKDLLPIIFLTAYHPDEIQVFKGYDNGAIDYLTKPVNKTVFLSKVNIFLELDQQKQKILESRKKLLESKIELEEQQKKLLIQNEILEKAKRDLEESRNKYLKLYNFAPTGFFTIDSEGIIKESNIKGAMFFEAEPDKIKNQNIKKLIAPGSLDEFNKFLKAIFDGNSQGCELSLYSGNGKQIYIYFEGALIDEKSTCLLSIADITEIKEAQIALKESEKLYHTLVKTSPDGIVINDLDGKIIEASDMVLSLFGLKEKTNIIGKHFIRFIPKSSLKSIVKIIQSVVNDGMVQNFEIQLLKADGTEFSGEISLTRIKNNLGEMNAFMSVLRDISERKLFEKQLRHTERMTGIGEMATGMAHEINQPLTTISLSIDNIIFSLENQTLTEDYLKNKLNKVFDNITRIKKIIDHVRTFSRDQDDFVHTNFNVNESIRNSLSMISEQFSHKEIELAFNPEKNIPEIPGNGYRFEQVILNLLVNAKDAIDEKKKKSYSNFKKKVEVITYCKNKHIYIEITDNGIGISPESIDKVLLPFYTTKAPGHGTGLGLSVSYGIIKELGGEIEIRSEPGAGTSILIKIPLTESKNKTYNRSYVQ